jgi:hypothetical protein
MQSFSPSNTRIFRLGLIIPLSDLPPQNYDETERELVFQRNFVSKLLNLSTTKSHAIIRIRSPWYRNTHLHQASGAVAQNLQRDLWAAFTAKHLPSLVDRILDLPPHGARPYGAEDYPLQNIYHTTLKFTDIAYLAKFMSSSRTIAEGKS